ncbi:MAG: PD-(D/E)XK nuclease family protein, partial [Gammaproteobacteria bacterium]|nr:PD-(D/E)XK nuclease family protein [Gammaproteobacteria bacterium]
TPSGARRLRRLLEALARWLPQRHERPPRSSLEGVWLECGGAAAYGNTMAIDHAEQLFELVDQLGLDGWDAAQLRAQAERLFAADSTLEKLEVLTIHKAKGLEWDHVLLPRLNGTTQADTPPLLRWQIQRNDGSDDDLLMAVKGTGGLYDWLGDEEMSRERNERRRLLYVACTRAKRSLMLTGAKWKSPSERNNERPWKPPSASLLALLWGDARNEISEESPAKDAETSDDKPLSEAPEQPKQLRRLLESFTWQQPARQPLHLPSTLVESTAPAPDTAGGRREVILGELIHEWLQRLSQRPLPQNANAWASEQQSSWRRQLHAAGLSEADAETCTQEAVRQFNAVLNDERGRWLLGPRQEAASEYGITGVIDGTLTSVRLDRTFEDGGERWIIDYKTGPIDSDEASISELTARYRPQLANYRILAEGLFDKPIRTALYLTAIPMLINV